MIGVSLEHVKKSFGEVKIIHDVSMQIEKGDFAVFVGPSGCGKSTLLRMIAGLETTSYGRIFIGERDVTEADPSDRGVAMVFQSYALYPHLTVYENMAFSLRLAKVPKPQIDEKVKKASKILKLDEQLQRKPSQLSGGQRQRVAIGRAIVRAPEVFLFDEPLSNLDAELRVAMRIELTLLHEQLGATMIYVTHDQVEAMTLADKIFVLKDGYVQQAGTPLELYDDPDNKFVAGFIGSPAMNFIKAKVKSSSKGVTEFEVQDGSKSTIKSALASNLAKGEAVNLGIRPEHLITSKDSKNAFQVTVNLTEELGGTSYLYAVLEDQSSVIIERRGSREDLRGAKILVTAEAEKILVFDEKDQRIR